MGVRLKFWRRSRVPKRGSREEAVGISRGFAARDGSAVKSHSTILQPRGGGGVLPYITYTGMCRLKGS